MAGGARDHAGVLPLGCVVPCGEAGVGVRAASKLCLSLAAVTLLVLLPLDYLWWRLLGYLP